MSSTLIERLRALPAAGPVLTALGGEPRVWVVGGAVRDLLLGGVPSDLDLVVEGDALVVARRAAERLGGEMTAHERFGTATVRSAETAFDLAGARRERYPQPGALPEVELGAPLQDDLERRDFTVNALALRLADGELMGAPGPARTSTRACCACSTTPPSATIRRGCCGSRATRAGWASRSSRTPPRWRASRSPSGRWGR